MMKHLTTTARNGRRAFPDATLKAIQQAIAEGETRHRAELRMIIEPALTAQAVLRGTTARERARELFSLYRIWDTEENCGVLIYLNLADRKVEIIADRAANRLLDARDWQAVCTTMTAGFAQHRYREAVLEAIEQLNRLLALHFPADGGRANELSNRPLVL